MPRGVAEFSREKSLHQIPRDCGSFRPAAETQDIQVIVLDALQGGKMIVNRTGARSRNLVGADRRADAAAANGHAPVNLPGGHSLRQWNDIVGVVVVGPQVMGTEISHVVSGFAEMVRDFMLQIKASVIPCDTDVHIVFLSEWVPRRARRIGSAARKGACPDNPPVRAN